MKALIINVCLLISINFTLTACGGGGGGGSTTTNNPGNNGNSSSASSGGGQLNYTGIQDPATINKNTADDITEAVQLAPSLILLTESITIPVPARAPNQTIDEKLENDKIILKGDISDNSGRLTVEYKNYTKNGLSISGKQTQNYVRDGFNLKISSLNFDNLEFISPTDRIRFKGTINWNTDGALSKNVILDFLITDVNSNKSTYFQNMSLNYKSKSVTTSVRSDDTLSINGTFFISSLGSIKISTSTPLPITPTKETVVDFSASTGGQLKLVGNKSEAVLYSISSSWFGFGIDTNNDQVIDISRRYNWNSADLVTAGIQPDTQPIVNAGYITHWQLNKPFQLNSLFSHFNDAFIEHEWTLIYKPTQSKATVKNINSPIQSFLPDAAGDYVFSVKIKSNGKSSSTNFVLRVYDTDIEDNHNMSNYQPPELKGSLELKKTETSILFDFQSYANNINSVDYRILYSVKELGNSLNEAIAAGPWLSPSVTPSQPGIYTRGDFQPINIAFKAIPFETRIGIKSDVSNSPSYQTFAGDFNNDQKDDILFLNTHEEIPNPTMNFGILQSTNQGYEIQYLTDMPSLSRIDFSYKEKQLTVADVNGDGFDDIIINTVTDKAITQKITVVFMKANNQHDISSIEIPRPCGITSFTADQYRVLTTGNILAGKGKEILIGDGCNNSINVVTATEDNNLIQRADMKNVSIEGETLTFSSYTSIKLTDLNNDGFDDIVTTPSNSFFSFLTNNKDGTFTFSKKYSPVRAAPYGYKFWIMKLADNTTTIFYIDGFNFYTVTVNNDLSTESYQWPDSLKDPLYSPSSVIAKDINSDGKKEIIISNFSKDEFIFTQQADGSFSLPTALKVSSPGYNNFYLDINNDGKLDLVYPSGTTSDHGFAFSSKDYDIFYVLLNGISEYSISVE